LAADGREVAGESGVLSELARHAAQSLAADAARVFVLGADDDRLELAAEYGAVADGAARSAEALAARAITAGAPFRGGEAGRFSRGGGAAAAPIHLSGRVAGALWAGCSERLRFDDEDLSRLAGLARIAAAALQSNADRAPQPAVSGGVAALASLLQLRDGYAAADAEQMVRLAGEIATRMGMDPDRLAELHPAARLHDIGKIGVADQILHKPGRLEPHELLVMQRHPVWGAEALARVPGLEGVAEVVRRHHERWDGQGYPGGLVAEAIPLASRIIAICEAYRAMTTERPYRRSIAPGQALGVLKQGAGSHFDPDVVAALVDVLARDGVTPAVRARDPRATAERPARKSGYGHRLKEAFGRLDALPALSESRDRLLGLLESERPSATDIVAVVESDLALVIAVLRLANRRSTGAERIGTVPEAIAALTPEGVEMLASRIAVVDFFEQPAGWGVPPEHIRLHAVAVQRAVDRIARETGRRDRDELLVASLLHDIGKLVLGYAVDGYPGSVHGEARTPEQRVRAERHATGLDHAAVGGVLLRRWRLPESLAVAVEGHHGFEPGGAAAVIALADMLAHHLHGQAIDRERLSAVAETVGLSAATLRSLMYELPAGEGNQRRSIEPCPLTPKELEVMRLLAQGLLYKKIGTELGLATSTVRSHLHKAYNKLGVADRAQAVLHCAERGWL
jgi:putative nucleotidyltransferase with HDIG domain